MNKLLDAVPGWVYALAMLLAGALSGFLLIDRANVLTDVAVAQRQTSDARAELATVKAQAATAAASAVQNTRANERELVANQTKATDELQTVIAARDDRIADLERWMHQLATTNTDRGGGRRGEGAPAAKSGNGAGIPGLRVVDAVDSLVIDREGQSQLAALAVSANDARATLKGCRDLLRQAWRSTN